MNAWMIANNPLCQISDANQIPKEDVVLQFNNAIHHCRFERSRNWILLNRFFDWGGGFFNYDNTSNRASFYEKTFFPFNEYTHKRDPWARLFDKYPTPKKAIIRDDLFNDEYPKEHRSAGYIATVGLGHLFDKIFLVGFSFSGHHCHAWDFEKESIIANPKTEIVDHL